MSTSIKITQLTSIGANISHTSLAPVVDMSGTPETKKETLQTIGNLILSEAGGTDFAPANVAVISQTVSNAAQPNITSVGTLSSLDVSGNVNVGNLDGGNLVSANFFSGDGGFLSNVTVSSTTVKTIPVTVSGLPDPAVSGAGTRAFVTDADENTFGSAVVGGGSNSVPVYSDGSAWYIG
jgi:hypothetical protein